MAADALFEQTGILRVDTVEGLFEVAQAFATQPIPMGDRVAILAKGKMRRDRPKCLGSFSRLAPSAIPVMRNVCAGAWRVDSRAGCA